MHSYPAASSSSTNSNRISEASSAAAILVRAAIKQYNISCSCGAHRSLTTDPNKPAGIIYVICSRKCEEKKQQLAAFAVARLSKCAQFGEIARLLKIQPTAHQPSVVGLLKRTRDDAAAVADVTSPEAGPPTKLLAGVSINQDDFGNSDDEDRALKVSFNEYLAKSKHGASVLSGSVDASKVNDLDDININTTNNDDADDTHASSKYSDVNFNMDDGGVDDNAAIKSTAAPVKVVNHPNTRQTPTTYAAAAINGSVARVDANAGAAVCNDGVKPTGSSLASVGKAASRDNRAKGVAKASRIALVSDNKRIEDARLEEAIRPASADRRSARPAATNTTIPQHLPHLPPPATDNTYGVSAAPDRQVRESASRGIPSGAVGAVSRWEHSAPPVAPPGNRSVNHAADSVSGAFRHASDAVFDGVSDSAVGRSQAPPHQFATQPSQAPPPSAPAASLADIQALLAQISSFQVDLAAKLDKQTAVLQEKFQAQLAMKEREMAEMRLNFNAKVKKLSEELEETCSLSKVLG
ncbi:hypothetical protein BDR26DRAFT_962827 [Obelidium mucronatum]|nr:hypothetical protein BDR26DRAFT_962827 [Obelidium mucronatum]